MHDKSLDCILIFKDENIYYLTGFYAKNSSSILIITPEKMFLLVHFIYSQEARISVILKEKIEIIVYTTGKKEKLAEIVNSCPYKSYGVESSWINYNLFTSIRNQLRKSGKSVKNLPSFIEKQREVKDALEVFKIKESCSITEKALNAVFGLDVDKIAGCRETEISMFIENKMVEAGASGKSFDLIVANNEASSLPHYIPKNKKIQSGLLLFDIGCVYDKYCSDITRTVFLNRSGTQGKTGKNNSKLKEIYDIVFQAQIRALQACREGVKCSCLDNVARSYIEKKGYGGFFGHGLGHGVGLEVHENPSVKPGSDTRLVENMVITIEPGIYLEGVGGVRIEDMVIVKKDRCEILYNITKELLIIEK